ncbi:MAG: aromatic ring-opening dioxygenase subunit LigA [Candidatus Sphingomonas colombiensis]|nr:aromatic ring-opening dioxygenase subunit LigA [Sphingomonas sp.]WEK43989.1 MAG: aromatic ring-opening dioxygenase subunit LigA [Sphingomonas sp.]
MSLYTLSKLMFALNREPELQARFKTDPATAIEPFRLTDEERGAVLAHDIGLLYVLGVNGQLLMHFAALVGIEWSDYLDRMRRGIVEHGPVRAGIYAMHSAPHERIAG